MTEYQILNMFWMQAISNAMFQLGVFILLWAALRGSLRIYDQGANLSTKIISSLLVHCLGLVLFIADYRFQGSLLLIGEVHHIL